MRIEIEEIHLGRYWVSLFTDEGELVSKMDGGSALIMVQLSRMIFEREHLQYQHDQRMNSDRLGEEAIHELHSRPTSYLTDK